MCKFFLSSSPFVICHELLGFFIFFCHCFTSTVYLGKSYYFLFFLDYNFTGFRSTSLLTVGTELDSDFFFSFFILFFLIYGKFPLNGRVGVFNLPNNLMGCFFFFSLLFHDYNSHFAFQMNFGFLEFHLKV